MSRTILVFAIGVFLPLAVVLGTLAGLAKTTYAPVPAWLYWGAQILGLTFVLWRLRPRPIRGVGLAVAYLLVYNFLVLNGGFAITNYYGGVH